jgi:hypothetical protein
VVVAQGAVAEVVGVGWVDYGHRVVLDCLAVLFLVDSSKKRVH